MNEPCTYCSHTHLSPAKCDSPITEDIRVGDGPYDRRGRFYRSIVVDTCRCTKGDTDD